jgi:hypothetical protein
LIIPSSQTLEAAIQKIEGSLREDGWPDPKDILVNIKFWVMIWIDDPLIRIV